MASWSDAWSGRSNDTMRLTVTQGTQNIANNTTVVNWYLDIVEVNGSWTNDPTGSYSININGSVYSGTVPGYDNNTTTRIRSGSTTVTHNADGTKTISVSASASGVNILGSASISAKSFALTTIPRATTPNFSGGSSFDAGASVTINLPRASTSFTHVVTYAFGSASGTISSAATTSVAWTPALSLLAQIPNAASGSGTLTVVTKNGSSTIGTKSISFTLKAPSYAVPSISSFTLSDNTPAIVSAIGAYVQGYSLLKGVIASAGYQGSTIVSATFKMGSVTANSGSTIPITSSGTVAVTATVTDSRGRSTTSTQNITVLAYSKPNIVSTWKASRSNATGTLQNEGTYIRIDLNATISSLIVSSTQKNSMTINVYTRDRGTTSWGTAKRTLTAALSYNSYFVIPASGSGVYLASDSYDVKVEVKDKIDMSDAQATVATANVFMHWSKTGVGMGKFHEQGTLDVAGDIYGSTDIIAGNKFTAPMIRLTSTGDVSAASTNHAFQIGPDNSANLEMDANEINALNNGVGAPLNINILGGDLILGHSAATVKAQGAFLQPLLPAPKMAVGASVQVITATSWATVPNIDIMSFSMPRACWVRIDYGAWMSGVGGDLRCAVALSGATVEDENDFDGTDGGWGSVMWAAGVYEQRSGFKIKKFNAGTTTVTMRAYKSGSGTQSVNYATLAVTPLQFV